MINFPERWAQFFFTPSRPHSLAIGRIIFYAGVLYAFGRANPASLADNPPEFWDPVAILRWLGLGVASAGTLNLLMLAFRASLVLSCLGLATRLSTVASLLLGTYLLALPNCFGKVNHSATLPLLTLLILACSRCGDALSLDSLIRRRLRWPSPPHLSSEYTWPIRLVWVLMVLAFFAAGYSKLYVSGLDWITTGHLQRQLMQHYLTDPSPAPLASVVARYPLVCLAFSFLTIVLELGAPLALVSRRLRALFIPGLLAMQIGIWQVMGIEFFGYIFLYPFWVPWDALLQRFNQPTPPAAAS